MGDWGLTEREKAVLELSARGLTQKEISRCLNISSHTIDYHHRNIIKKLNARNITSAVAIAVSKGIIRLQ